MCILISQILSILKQVNSTNLHNLCFENMKQIKKGLGAKMNQLKNGMKMIDYYTFVEMI